jgi:1-deoxy-D-xylulose-5-phosphate reductoisomerase
VKTLTLLGSTGSIGTSTLDVVLAHPGEFRIAALAAGSNLERIEAQARAFGPELVVVRDGAAAAALAGRLPPGTRLLHGIEGLVAAARHPEADVAVCALVGAIGVEPTYAAIDAGKTIALANKEALVVGGAFLTARARETGSMILPVDSEHNAIHQCLRGESPAEVETLWLTASGGPFRGFRQEALRGATAAEALRHPTWVMGPKVTVDSATLMNKGLEVIEAHWLFGVQGARIRVVIHPKSVVHSLVEFVDGSWKAQLGATDMRHPIQYALTWPRRIPSLSPPFDLLAAGPLEFFPPDPERFPCLPLAYEALAAGGAAPAVLNAANEVAVEAFLAGRAGFLDIPVVVRRALERHASAPARSLVDLFEADRAARATTAKALASGVQS